MLCFPTVTHIITAAGLPSADRKMSNRYSYLSDERRQEVLKTYGESDELANATLVVWEKKNRYVSWLVIIPHSITNSQNSVLFPHWCQLYAIITVASSEDLSTVSIKINAIIPSNSK